jgi:hypothetical protein
MADDDWMIVFQNAYGETQQIPMIEVGSLVSVDEAYDFSILSISGEVLAEGVTRVSFQQGDVTKIEPKVESGNMISRMASDKIILIGAKGTISVFNTTGAMFIQMNADGGETVVNIAHLPNGIYIVKTGSQTFKFMKK